MMFTSKKNSDLISREDILNDEGKIKTSVFKYPNMIVRVHFPDISEEENERRMKRIHDAAADVLKEVIRKNGNL